MNNNTITASRMASLLRCPRAHFWQYEMGLVKDRDGIALRLGSAWHRAMEAWNKGYSPEDCLTYACADATDLDEYSVATITGLFRGYIHRWGNGNSVVKKLHPELPFRYALNDEFDVAGVVDGLGTQRDNRSVLVESKTSGASVAPESKFWLRLRFNPQVYQYALAARLEGWEIDEAVYDVARKPCIQPRDVPVLDADDKKIVIDSAGDRVLLKNGEPRQSADKAQGFEMVVRKETPEEFCDRLASDCVDRPDFYFARKVVPIIDGDLRAFEVQRIAIGRMILHFRSNQCLTDDPADAWPRAVSEMNCNFCQYQSFCLNNSRIDVARPPEGFAVKPFNPELERNHDIDPAQEEPSAA